MQELWKIYHHEIPEFLKEFMNTKAMLRLKDIGMNCGIEYTSFPVYEHIQPYSRYDHSVGVALIIWHFTHDMKQTIAGLFHDISTPVFAHTIDFMNGDYVNQESTEQDTKKIIEDSLDIQELCHHYHFKTKDICNYHLYPIADNDSPQLSADRLEYTLGNMYNFHFASLDDIKEIYHDLIIGVNENNKPEIVFQTRNSALKFFTGMMKNSRIYISDEDRFAMEELARLIRFACEKQIITASDLYTNESDVIQKIENHHLTKQMWKAFQNYSQIKISQVKKDKYYRVDAKKRYINPLLHHQRLSQVYQSVANEINQFENIDFDYWIGCQ